MFSDGFYRLLAVYGKIAELVGGSPFHWSEKTRSFQVSETSLRRFHKQAALLLSLTTYLGIKCYHVQNTRAISEIGFPMSCFLAMLFNMCPFTVFLIQPKFMAAALNAILQYWERFTSKQSFLSSKSLRNYFMETLDPSVRLMDRMSARYLKNAKE